MSSKNEFRMFWTTCMPNFMLVDKSAPSSPLEPEPFGLSMLMLILLNHYMFVETMTYLHHNKWFESQ